MTRCTRSRQRLTALGIVAVFLIVPAPGVAAQTDTPCNAKFPAQDWVAVGDGERIAVYGAAIDDAVLQRFAGVAEEVADLVAADFSALPNMTVCIYGPDTALDATELSDAGLHPPGARLHAALFAEEGLLFVDSQQIRLVEDAIALGVSHLALWQVAAVRDEMGYPNPLADAIAQWYVSRINGEIEQHRATMRVGTFFADPRGTAAPTDWFAGRQEPVMVWNPEFQESPIGDFVDDAVRRNGVQILVSFDPSQWAEADIQWRAALRDELLQGADESRDWVGGVILAIAVVLGAIGIALFGVWQRRRKEVAIGDIARVDGFFGETKETSA